MRISDWSSDVCSSDLVRRLGVRPGDRVVVQCAGDVIPQILENLTPDEDRPRYVFPDHCPECGSTAKRESDEVIHRCTGGLLCPAHRVARLRHFVSRCEMDIGGEVLGYIESFIRAGMDRC